MTFFDFTLGKHFSALASLGVALCHLIAVLHLQDLNLAPFAFSAGAAQGVGCQLEEA